VSRLRQKAVTSALSLAVLAVLGAGLAGCKSNDNGGVIVPPPDTTTSVVGTPSTS
jgi:hypothetical protein